MTAQANRTGKTAGFAALETLSERAAGLVERDVLTGVWEPGQRLGIQALSGHYGIGPTPLREGLSRLVSRGLILATGQKGFRVAGMSVEDLSDITRVRVVVEKEALRRSIRHGGEDWEAGIVASLHRLRRVIERSSAAAAEGADEFDRLHKAFHRSLLEGCGSDRLLNLHDDLYYQAYRYRRIMMSRFADYTPYLDTHASLAEAALSRDSDRAEAELTLHLHQTLFFVYGVEYPGTES